MLLVTNSTFVSNTATGFDGSFGGAIADSGTASLSYVTANVNAAATGGGIAITSGAQSTVIRSTAFIRTRRAETSLSPRAASSSQGHNLFSDDPAVTLGPNDLVNTDPLLGGPKDNGGFTFTEALLSGSPAIDAGIAVVDVTTDQRGEPRPSSGPTDVGAFQVEPQPPLTVVSLRLAGTKKLVLTFNLPLDVARAVSLANYNLAQYGGKP